MGTFRYVSIDGADAVEGAAVVIDVFRAFSTAAWALEGGADSVVLARDLASVERFKSRINNAVACGDGPPREGFELVNSPVKVQNHDLVDRAFIQLTTNGTVGALAARKAEPLYCASFLTARATAVALRRAQVGTVTFVITGDNGTADEDLACADYIAALAESLWTDPAPYLERAARSAAAHELRRGVALGHEGVHEDDIACCLQADRFAFAMIAVASDDTLKLYAYK